jgi:hypothetical protein
VKTSMYWSLIWLCEWLLKVFILCWNTCVVEQCVGPSIIIFVVQWHVVKLICSINKKPNNSIDRVGCPQCRCFMSVGVCCAWNFLTSIHLHVFLYLSTHASFFYLFHFHANIQLDILRYLFVVFSSIIWGEICGMSLHGFISWIFF